MAETFIPAAAAFSSPAAIPRGVAPFTMRRSRSGEPVSMP